MNDLGINRRTVAHSPVETESLVAQLARRFTWWPDGVTVATLAADLDWPGGAVGVVGLLANLLCQGRAHVAGDLWFNGPGPTSEDHMSISDDILDDVRKHGPTTPAEVRHRTGIDTTSQHLSLLHAAKKVERREGAGRSFIYAMPGMFDLGAAVDPPEPPPSPLVVDPPASAADDEAEQLRADLAAAREHIARQAAELQAREGKVRGLTAQLAHSDLRLDGLHDWLWGRGKKCSHAFVGLTGCPSCDDRMTAPDRAAIREHEKRTARAAVVDPEPVGECPEGWADYVLWAIDRGGDGVYSDVIHPGDPEGSLESAIREEGWNGDPETAWVGMVRLKAPALRREVLPALVDLRGRRA